MNMATTKTISLKDFEAELCKLGETITLDSIVETLRERKPNWFYDESKRIREDIPPQYQDYQAELWLSNGIKYYLAAAKTTFSMGETRNGRWENWLDEHYEFTIGIGNNCIIKIKTVTEKDAEQIYHDIEACKYGSINTR